MDPIKDAVKGKTSTKNVKVSLHDGTTVYHAVYDSGSNEAFITQVQQVLNFCKNEGIFKAYKQSKLHLQDCVIKHKNAKDKLQEAINDPTTSEDRMKALEKSQQLGGTAVLLASKAIPRRGKQLFFL